MAMVYKLRLILGSPGRDYLLRNNGDLVKVDTLKGKMLGLYFSESRPSHCQEFTQKLVEFYEHVPKDNFEVVFISTYGDSGFDEYFAKMPWLAVPPSDYEKLRELYELYECVDVPCLVIEDELLDTLTKQGVFLIESYGRDAFPFSSKKIQDDPTQLMFHRKYHYEFKRAEREEDKRDKVRRNRFFTYILTSPERDYVITSVGRRVPVSDFEAKLVGLYFSFPSSTTDDFTKKLVGMYQDLKRRKKAEIVMIPLYYDKKSYDLAVKNMPWYALPYEDDKHCFKLSTYFEVGDYPALIVIDQDGNTLNPNAVEHIELYGSDGFTFTPQTVKLFEEEKEEIQTLEKLLTFIARDLDYVIGKSGAKIPVSDLVGKTIFLYFGTVGYVKRSLSLPKFIEIYKKIKAMEDSFEVIFISFDLDQTTFDKGFCEMPWLALPFGDIRKKFLIEIFKVRDKCLPMGVVIGPNGKTVTKKGISLISEFHEKAYPFTVERVKKLYAELDYLPEKRKKEMFQEYREEMLEKGKKDFPDW